ncbi:5-amino-6-(5-phospho-D-ribitylamino)uracil phosphatase, chloroplastic isoform X2 [Populus trichocarpa]|uniref:5-amino-6-(5-phospho-D-ribitylamino)uracil phosphatase, chloroplastic isoform X2 n=1 Tax=Populus trichocarpa TaxID=3694 RepID=UPI000D18A75D|nr:5-amino-6-(5-phospho-D-ribitylamino)uracil phosphatase, chloroplastic isoform X2 [Populus trichocarpa]|eukprot:XP_024446800.1 5-amino-6-(5-phospho-D-ribitylamino)uracil phosphatase, chloroplastic-like isoform X2 [Populus trichocarpa]
MKCRCSNFKSVSSSSSSTSSLLLPPSPSSSGLPHSLFSHSKLKLPKLKANHRLVIKNACGFDNNDGLPVSPKKLFMQEAIGAEYGEGFETFRQDGLLKVDVADTRSIKLNVWKQLAIEEGKEIPEDELAQRLMLYADADHILHKGLLWETAESEVVRLKLRLSQLYHANLLGLREPIEGLEEWLDAVSRVHIPCAVVSCLDRINMVGALERMGLKKYFQAIVSEEDGMESIAHRFLSAAMKLDRKPSKCVVFEDDPRGIAAAHNCTMMAVGLIGAHPAYDLVQADLAVASFNELSVINLRRLFANKGSTFMDRQKEIVEKSPPKRKLSVDTIY